MVELLEKVKHALDVNPTEPDVVRDYLSVVVGLTNTHPKDCLRHGRYLCEHLRKHITKDLDIETLTELHALYEQALFAIAKDDLDSYILYMEWNREPEKRAYAPRRRVLKTALVDPLQALEDDDIDFLAVSLPPRVGKSITCKFFMTWHMGRHPDDSNAMTSYSGEIAKGFYKDMLTLIKSSEYRFADVFPDAKLVNKSDESLTLDLRNARTLHTLTCRGIEGTWTGLVEVSKNGVLYSDDLVRDEEEAANTQRLNSLFAAYINHVRDRRKPGAKELMVGTRWNVYDPIGRFENEYGEDPRYRFVVVPALDDNGESNFRYDGGVGFTTQYFQEVKRLTDDANWQAKYMGAPYVREGLLYPAEELRRYFTLPQEPPEAVIAVVDTKDRGEDYEFCPIAYKYGLDYYIADCICDNNTPDKVEPRVLELLLEHKVQLCRFESNAAGGRVAKDMQDKLTERGWATRVTTKFSRTNKMSRIIAATSFVKKRCLFLDDSVHRSEDYKRMMRMLTNFTLTGKNAHDDVPDGLAMLSSFAEDTYGTSFEPFVRPF